MRIYIFWERNFRTKNFQNTIEDNNGLLHHGAIKAYASSLIQVEPFMYRSTIRITLHNVYARCKMTCGYFTLFYCS